MSEEPKPYLWWKFLLLAVIIGTITTAIAGLIENPPLVGITDYTYYGYPLVWRISILNQPTEIMYLYLVIDAAFWIGVAFLILSLMKWFLTRD